MATVEDGLSGQATAARERTGIVTHRKASDHATKARRHSRAVMVAKTHLMLIEP